MVTFVDHGDGRLQAQRREASNGGHGEINSELLGLGETPPGEFLAADPGGKAEVVLDARAGARLTSEAPTVDDEGR